MDTTNWEIASDVDDVLVHVCPKWLTSLAKHPEISHYLNGQYSATDISENAPKAFLRDTYDLWTWLRQLHPIPVSLRSEYLRLYTEDEEFYQNLPPTKVCLSLIRALQSGGLGKLHLVTHILGGDSAATKSKRAWVKNVFGSLNYELHEISPQVKKSEVLRKITGGKGSIVKSFIEDKMANVIDVLSHEQPLTAEILLPRMGHNNIHRTVDALARLQNIELFYYHDIT
jgi:hypothetical protein